MNTSPAPQDVRQHILDTARPILGCKGFSAVGLTEILCAAGVPKGSFYHYFASKEAFGEALLEQYFTTGLVQIDAILSDPNGSAAERLMRYWQGWRDRHAGGDACGQCLAVKLGAEVCDLSEGMRAILEYGTRQIVARVGRGIAAGGDDGSLPPVDDPRHLAMVLYQLWLGATLLAKFTRNSQPFDEALATTRILLALPP
ncbi:TetR family transcriptional regulator [Gluconacetobacter tumulisoli]|uniref:TetR/AcrR family transcriptional regulator n=1 Tax=Gluconacetobacter tumulisoli TaxID=1286189 RepID=A0A7W4K5S4_9PROT|nr:TetR/AcrR family transcriptional regulator [Gluconacetobacter tumulisoli]